MIYSCIFHQPETSYKPFDYLPNDKLNYWLKIVCPVCGSYHLHVDAIEEIKVQNFSKEQVEHISNYIKENPYCNISFVPPLGDIQEPGTVNYKELSQLPKTPTTKQIDKLMKEIGKKTNNFGALKLT